jgi:hypothetical protein
MISSSNRDFQPSVAKQEAMVESHPIFRFLIGIFNNCLQKKSPICAYV